MKQIDQVFGANGAPRASTPNTFICATMAVRPQSSVGAPSAAETSNGLER
jgi:hypothetical protein